MTSETEATPVREALAQLCNEMGWVAGPDASYADAANRILRAVGSRAPIGAIGDAASWLDDRADAALSFSSSRDGLGGDPHRDERAASAAADRAAAAWFRSLAEALRHG